MRKRTGSQQTARPEGAGTAARLRALAERHWEQLATIEGNLMVASAGQIPKSLMITSCHPGDGKSTVAGVTGWALSNAMRNRVLLVDGNLARPALHTLFDLPAEPGLTDIIDGKVPPSAALHRTVQPNLHLLPAGHRVEDPLQVFRNERFAALLDRLKERYDYLIFDGAHYIGHSDSSFVTPLFDGTILVVSCEQTRWEVAQRVRDRIEAVGGRLLGAVMNRRRYYIPRWAYRFL